MTKAEFFKEVKDIGVDLEDKRQMKVWTLALLAMGQKAVDSRFERCTDCYYANGKEGKLAMSSCPNRLCPVKNIPSKADEMVEYMFSRNEYIDLRAFYREYVVPVLNKLIEQEERMQNAKNKNS